MLNEATPIGKFQSLENSGIERLPAITAVAINLVPIAFEIVAKRCTFSKFFLLGEIGLNLAYLCQSIILWIFLLL